MTTKARDVLLEIKRRLGDTNSPFPDEADALAFLNRALLAINNYGLYRHSERLKVIETKQSGTGGSVAITDGISSISNVIHKSSEVPLFRINNATDLMAISDSNPAPQGYTLSKTNDSITIVPAPTAGTEFVIEYIPQFKKLTKRTDAVPFCPELETVISDWTCALIAGKQSSVSDIDFAANQGYANTLGNYFRSVDRRTELIGHGPW